MACEDDAAARKSVRHSYMSGKESQGADEPHVGNDRLVGRFIVFICCLVGLDCKVWERRLYCVRKDGRRELDRRNPLSRVAMSFPPDAVFSSSTTPPSSRMRFLLLNKSAQMGCIMSTAHFSC